MMTELRCLTVRQPWASLLVDPTLPKWIETRSRPTKVRGTIGIIAGKHRMMPIEFTDEIQVFYSDPSWYLRTGDGAAARYPLAGDQTRRVPMALGALIGTVDLYDCIPIVEERGCPDAPDCPEGMITVAGPHSGHMGHLTWLTWHHTVNGRGRFINRDRTDDANAQRPYGDFRSGGWAWLTRNPVLFDEPIPMAGSQGWKTINR